MICRNWSIIVACYNVSPLRMLLRSHSMNADDTESELAAIPESPKSDSTLHGSSGGSLGEMEDSAIPKHAFLQEPRMSIISDGASTADRSISKSKTESGTKPIWFLGSEDDAGQVMYHLFNLFNYIYNCIRGLYNLKATRNYNNWYWISEIVLFLFQSNKGVSQKKWSVYEGVKMMVTSTFLTGQQELPPKLPSKTAMPIKNGKTSRNGDTVSSKPYDFSSALAVATSISHIQR